MGEAAAAASFQEEKQIRVVRGRYPAARAALKKTRFCRPGSCHQEPEILRKWIYVLCLTLESLAHPFDARYGGECFAP